MKQGVRIWPGFLWLRIGIILWFSEFGNELSGSVKDR
jgi:hypothetical protein